MNIGTVAKKFSVPRKTMRYYESSRLVASAPRGANGNRIYEDTRVQTLRFMERARGLGTGVEEVAGLLALWRGRVRTSAADHGDAEVCGGSADPAGCHGPEGITGSHQSGADGALMATPKHSKTV